jgi:hypothetical protein
MKSKSGGHNALPGDGAQFRHDFIGENPYLMANSASTIALKNHTRTFKNRTERYNALWVKGYST